MTSIMGDRAAITWTLTDLGTRKSSRDQGYATKVMKYGLALVRILSLMCHLLLLWRSGSA